MLLRRRPSYNYLLQLLQPSLFFNVHRLVVVTFIITSSSFIIERRAEAIDTVRLEVVPVVVNPVVTDTGVAASSTTDAEITATTIMPTTTTTIRTEPSAAVTTTMKGNNGNDEGEEDFGKLLPEQQQWILEYLLRYGYLDVSYSEQTTTSSFFAKQSAPQRLIDPRRGGSDSDEDVENGVQQQRKSPVATALGRFQAFSGLKPSGRIDFATRHQLALWRCGVRDVDSDFSVVTATSTAMPMPVRHRRYAASPNIRWKRKRLTYKFLNYSASLGAAISRKLVERALDQWAKAAGLEVVEEAVVSAPADITFLFARKHHGDAYRFDGVGAVLAHAFFPGEQRGGEVHFDDDEEWFDRDGVDTRKMGGVDLFAVALHEIGHALGLGHSAVPDSVMNPWYNNYAADPRLGDDDLHALTFLYGSGLWIDDEVESNSKRPVVIVGSKPDLEQPGGQQGVDKSSTPPRPEDRVPDVCDTDFDAISIIRNKIYAFRQKNLWQFESDGSLSVGFPMAASEFFKGLPVDLERIDAFYERRTDHDVVIFSGDRYWRFRPNNALIPGFPSHGRPVLELGLPGDVHRIDAAFVWSGNLYTYLVAGDRYWRLDELRNHVDFTYPRPVDRFWRGVPLPLNSAFLNTDGVTYFVVKNDSSSSSSDAANSRSLRRFIPFDDYRLEAARSRPLETTKLWTACLALNTSLETRAMPSASSAAAALVIIKLQQQQLLFIAVALFLSALFTAR